MSIRPNALSRRVWLKVSPSIKVRIRRRFAEACNPATIALLRRGTFCATLVEEGVNVDNLGNLPFLPWAAFDAAVQAIREGHGRAPRGTQ